MRTADVVAMQLEYRGQAHGSDVEQRTMQAPDPETGTV